MKAVDRLIFATPRIDAAEGYVLEGLEKARERLKYTLGTPRRWSGLLRRSTLARAIRGSNSIEGYNVSKDDAVAVVEGEEPLDADEETKAATRGYRDAMTYVLQLADDPHFRYSAGLVRGLHFMMMSYNLAKNPGRWRPGPIYVHDEARQEIVYEAPDAGLIEELTEELFGELNGGAGAPAVARAAMAHLNLVMIHPFSDGNGRMARCLQTLVLAREGILQAPFCSIEEYLGRNTRSYYDVLAEVGQGRWNPRNDARPWLRYCLRAHHHQVMTLIRRTVETERVWDRLEELVKRRQLPERVMFALSDAAFGYRVRNATYRRIAEVSDQVASRDLRLLVDEGLLVADGEKRGRAYRAADVLKEMMEKSREPRAPMGDPFADPYLPGLEPGGE